MATRTAAQSGLWSDTATWGGTVPVNGDAFNIPAGVVVKCDVDQSGMAAGMAASVIDGLLHFDADTNTCLKMNGNLTGTGALYICERATVTGFTLTTGKTNTYQVARSLGVATVEDTLGAGYLDAVEELVEVAIDVENAARIAQGLNEMMPDAVQDFIETTKASLTLSQILAYVEATAGSFYHDTVNDILYIHTSDSTDPSGKTITVIEPINRPAAGSEYRCYILFNSTGTIAMTGTPIIRAYGWYPEREWTQLAADAASGQNQIVLTKDFGLQAGDKVCIASGTSNNSLHIFEPTAKGVYSVQSYNLSTKTVNLTGNLQTNRLETDYVCIASRPIRIGRSAAGGNAIITNNINSIIIRGIEINTFFVSNDIADRSGGHRCAHCTSQDKVLFNYSENTIISDSTRVAGASSHLMTTPTEISKIKRCITLGGAFLGYGNKIIHENCVSQNNTQPLNGIIKNSIMRNFLRLNNGFEGKYIKNSIVKGNDVVDTDTGAQCLFVDAGIECVDCVFEDNSTGYFLTMSAKLHNCLFEGENEINEHNWIGRPAHSRIESFNHNQQAENYKAWCKGGKIETDMDGSTPLPGRLILTCESADYPVFRDFLVLLPAYRTSTWQALTKKSFTGGNVKIELIDPANDPLIDPSSAPLASYSLPDQADTNLPLKLGYKSDKAMQAIIRISAQNASGIVEVDTRLIENRVQHGQ